MYLNGKVVFIRFALVFQMFPDLGDDVSKRSVEICSLLRL